MTSANATPGVPRSIRRVLASSFLGNAIEFYDFLLYSVAAALVFDKVFFTSLDPAPAAIASFSTFAVGFLVRPLGGIVFGHFGDRFGRRTVLIVCMSTMGASTVGIGLLPSTEQIGALAPLLLVGLRLIQGLAVGGEWGGAVAIALEHAPAERRGFASSFASLGGPTGAMIATLAMAWVSTLPKDDFYSWGWRLPFLASLILVAIGLMVRLRVQESPTFRSLDNKAHTRRIPVQEILQRFPRTTVIGILAAIPQTLTQGIMTVWALQYATAAGAKSTDLLLIKSLSALCLLGVTFYAARLSDRVGRSAPLLIGMAGSAVWAVPCLLLVSAGDIWLFALALVVAQILQGFTLGPVGSFLAELFPTRVRFTGSSIAFQGGSTLGGGLSPTVAASLIYLTGSVYAVAGFWIVGCVLGMLAVRGRDRSRLSTEELERLDGDRTDRVSRRTDPDTVPLPRHD